MEARLSAFKKGSFKPMPILLERLQAIERANESERDLTSVIMAYLAHEAIYQVTDAQKGLPDEYKTDLDVEMNQDTFAKIRKNVQTSLNEAMDDACAAFCDELPVL